MSLVKRGRTWHTHFFVDGQRFRQSLETSDWREAQSKEKELIGQAVEGKISQTFTSLARQPFGQAADDYVTARKLELASASQAKEKQLLVQLRAYLAKFRRVHYKFTGPAQGSTITGRKSQAGSCPATSFRALSD